MPAIVCNASFSTTCPRKPNSIQNAFILRIFLSCVLNSQPNYKLRNTQVIYKTPSTCSWLFFNFVKNSSSATKMPSSHFEAHEIAKMLHNVYKG
ncbi:hypothetical protein MTP99_004998 [Tenebrio molitor]|nr:hypothetical protein MTP99_004998 [Tenebrio molitor]